jgi:general secretion pathway protein B
MSYILDALKKSERERKKGTVPDPLAVQYSFSQHKKRSRKYWPYLLLIALIINAAAIYIFWFGQDHANRMDAAFDRSEKVSVVESPRTPAGLAGTADDEVSHVAKEKKPGTEKPSGQPGSPSTALQQSHESLAGSVITVPGNRMHSGNAEKTYGTAQAEPHNQLPADISSSEQKHEATVIPAPLPDKIYSMSELPLAIQQNLPAFSISAFLYSDDPAARMVRVNGKMMREGDNLAEGLKLDEIRQNELIFSYQNYRIRLGIK